MKLHFRTVLYLTIPISLIICYFFFNRMQKEYEAITTFENCVDAGYPVLPTYPEQCAIPGKTFTNTNQSKVEVTEDDATTTKDSIDEADYRNSAYTLEGTGITLRHGKTTLRSIPSLNGEVVISYFGNDVIGDFNKDKITDRAFLLTAHAATSSILYYLVAAIGTDPGYLGTNALYLGADISPQTTELRNNEIVVNYSERHPGEATSTNPSVGVSRYFKVVNGSLIEIIKY